jgi:plastocyanin
LLRFARKVLPLGLLLVLFTQGTAHAANVSIRDNFFSPATSNITLGESVTWTNDGFNPHTSTGDGDGHYTGPALWDSPTLPRNGTYQRVFNMAAAYGYHCDVHTNMRATINVPMTVQPTSGTANETVFTLTWATGSIPNGFNVDIQYRRNNGAWTNLLLNQTGNQTSISRMAPAPGNYDLRARVQNSNTNGATAYSPPVRAVVS